MVLLCWWRCGHRAHGEDLPRRPLVDLAQDTRIAEASRFAIDVGKDMGEHTGARLSASRSSHYATRVLQQRDRCFLTLGSGRHSRDTGLASCAVSERWVPLINCWNCLRKVLIRPLNIADDILDGDPIFCSQDDAPVDRAMLALKSYNASELCVQFCDDFGVLNDLYLWLLYENAISYCSMRPKGSKSIACNRS